MRPYSKKRQQLNRRVAPARKAFLEEFFNCMNPHCVEASTCVHEIAGGPARVDAIGIRATWLALCWPCNSDKLEDRSLWPIERQLALKLVCDPAYFDIETVNKLRGRAPGAITLEDVVRWLRVV